MDYDRTLDYVNSFINFENIPQYNYTSSFRLERMHAFLQELGNPQQGLDVIHVAGSKGKGSTCVIIAYLLRQAGYRTGLYTSPHLLDARERIRVLTRRSSFPPSLGLWQTDLAGDSEGFEGSIGKKEFIGLIEKIRPVAERFRNHKEFGKLSFFEILTACAFLYFKEKKVDLVILETGLGGRLDATNVIIPLVSGITNISLEHTDKLGSSLDSIAKEKAGIVKGRGLVVSALQEEGVRNAIRDVCRERNATLYKIGRDVSYSIVDSNENAQTFNLDGPDYSYRNLQINLIGLHQVENAALAIAMLKAIDKDRVKIDEKTIRSGLKKISWPGRLQVVQRDPYVVLDGAQNVASIKAVISSIKKIFYYNRLISVFGISSDKDIEGVSKELDKISNVVILTKSKNERAKDPLYLKENFSRPHLKLSGNIEEALEEGLRIASKKDLLLVTGSLYVVGEAIRFFKGRPRPCNTKTLLCR